MNVEAMTQNEQMSYLLERLERGGETGLPLPVWTSGKPSTPASPLTLAVAPDEEGLPLPAWNTTPADGSGPGVLSECATGTEKGLPLPQWPGGR